MDANIYINTAPISIVGKGSSYIIHFADKISEIVSPSNELFAKNTSIDIPYWTTHTKSMQIIDGVETTIIKMTNMCLFQNLTIQELLIMIGTILKISTIKLNVKLDRTELAFAESIPGLNTYSNLVCVGNKSISFYTSEALQTDHSNYFANIFKKYTIINNYIADILKMTKSSKNNGDTKNDEHDEIKLQHAFSKMEISLFPRKQFSVNTPLLFNIHSTGDMFKRIIIHDRLLDLYHNNTNVQYIKVQTNQLNTVKHIQPKTDTLSLFIGLPISEEITLSNIDIRHDGVIAFIINISHDMLLEQIMSSVNAWFDSYKNDLLNDLKLCEATYDDISIDDYEFIMTNFNSTYVIPDNTVRNIKALSKILRFDGVESRFQSNTSISFNQYSFLSTGLQYMLACEFSTRDTITENTFISKLCPEVHAHISPLGELSINCIRFNSIAELVFSLGLILPLVKYKNIVTEIDGDDEVERITKRCRSIPTKKNLKQLIAQDPELFATRKLNKDSRSYSALCQKKEQRPSIITAKEYEILREHKPNSVVNLQNQTYPDQRIYLYCPYEKFEVLNYHHFVNQLCIIRCTTKTSNPTQYKYCSESLDAANTAAFQTKTENQSIVYYNEYITQGRRCYLPNEIKHILINFVLYKPKLDGETIVQFLNRVYGIYPYIIRRNDSNKTYELITEYVDRYDYALCIETENTGEIMLVIHEKTSSLLIFDENPQIKKFFKRISQKSAQHTDFMRFIIEYIVDAPASEVNDMSLFDFVKYIQTKHRVRFVYKKEQSQDRLIGLIQNNDGISVYYAIPNINWMYVDGSGYVRAETIYKSMLDGSTALPSINKFAKYDPETYVNFADMKIKAVLLDHVIMYVKPIVNNRSDFVLYDVDTHFKLLMISTSENIKRVKPKLLSLEETNFFNVLSTYIDIYIKRTPAYMKLSHQKNMDGLIEILEEYGAFGENTFFKYIDRSAKYISFRKSRFNREHLMEYIKHNPISFNKSYINKMIYIKILADLKLNRDTTETIYTKQFI